MALKQEHQTRVGDRVRIKDSVTHMYAKARTYNEGLVRKRRHDPLGYPLIFVQWDRNHWAYSGEEDGWVMEAHFDLVEDQMGEDKNNDLLKALADLVQNFQSGEPEEEKKEQRPRPDGPYTYDETLKMAAEDAAGADAFIVLVARPEEFDGTEIVAPHIYVHSKRDDAAMMLEATMADAAAQTHARLVVKLIEQAKRDAESHGSSGS